MFLGVLVCAPVKVLHAPAVPLPQMVCTLCTPVAVLSVVLVHGPTEVLSGFNFLDFAVPELHFA
jgi:hypothetical protein